MLRKIRNRATVYMDNLSVHHSKVITDLFSERVDARFLPPYSCVLNPIERLWSQIKK
jgi:transposase